MVSLCGGRGTVAGCCLTEESGQAVPHSGPPRDGAPNPLTALCIVYVPAALVSTPGDPSRDTIPGDLLSVYLSLHFYAEYIMRIAGLDEPQAAIKTLEEIPITS